MAWFEERMGWVLARRFLMLFDMVVTDRNLNQCKNYFEIASTEQPRAGS